MNREDWRRSWKPWLRGTADRLPLRRDPGRWRGDPDVPVLRDGEEAHQAPGGVRPRRHRGRRRARGDEQRLGRRRSGPPAHPGHPHHRDRCSHARRVRDLRHPARPAPARRPARARVGPDRQPVHRQRDPARPQPAARHHLGPAAQHPAPLPLRRHPLLRQHRGLRREHLDLRPVAAAHHRRCSGSSCAASASRWCPRSSASSSARSPRSSCAGPCRSATASSPASINTPFSKVVYAIVVVLLVAPVVIDRVRSRRGGDTATAARRHRSLPARQPGRPVTMADRRGVRPPSRGPRGPRPGHRGGPAARRRLVVLNVSRGDALVDSRFASSADWDAVKAQLEASGVEHEVARPSRPATPPTSCCAWRRRRTPSSSSSVCVVAPRSAS